jgi:nicotinamide-nucleotide adenylyltransferase
MKVIRDAFNEDKDLVIAIGSAQKQEEKDNPFSADERSLMLEQALKDSNIRARLVLIPDIDYDSDYIMHVEEYVGSRPDHIITENPMTIRIFSAAGYDVRQTDRHFELSATQIRQAISKGTPWEHLVPESVAKKIKEIKGIERIKRLYSTS